MNDRDLLDRITFNPEIFGGKAIIRGRRLAVEHVLEMLAAGSTVEELIEEYRWLELDDLRACFSYAARLAGRRRSVRSLAVNDGDLS